MIILKPSGSFPSGNYYGYGGSSSSSLPGNGIAHTSVYGSSQSNGYGSQSGYGVPSASGPPAGYGEQSAYGGSSSNFNKVNQINSDIVCRFLI